MSFVRRRSILTTILPTRKTNMATIPYPIRLPEALDLEIKEVATATSLTKPETMRQAIKIGLPVLKERLLKTSKSKRAS
jgi:hypothetical protein